jgi:hypothetical protein
MTTASSLAAWAPPAEWREVRPGIWEPPTYIASPWELVPPAVRTPIDAHREFERCRHPRRGLAYFALHYSWTLHVDDPSMQPQIRRLPAFPYVRELLLLLQDPSNMLSEKARQVLTSWIYMTAFLYDILFRRTWPTIVSSRRGKEVDDGGENSTPDSLLGKLRFIADRLPPFLYQRLDYKLGMVSNPNTSSYVRGETGSGDQVARGPAYRRALMDEAAYQPAGEGRFSGFRQSCKNGLALNSTANGRGNVFARLAHSKTTTFKKVRIHWTRHPEKAQGLACLCGWKMRDGAGLPDAQFDAHKPHCPRKKGPSPTSPWYRAQVADLTPEQVASELDINYDRSSAVKVFDAYDATKHVFEVAAAVDRRTRRPIGEPRDDEAGDDGLLRYKRRALAALIDPSKPPVIFWDFGVSDETAIFFGQVDVDTPERKATRWHDELVDRGKDFAFYHRYIASVWYPAYLEACGWTPAAMQAWAKKRAFDWSDRPVLVPDLQNEVPRGCLPMYHAGDPAGRQRDSSLSSWTRNLEGADPSMPIHHVPFGSNPDDGSLLDWIDECRTIVRRGDILLSSFCTRFADAFGNWSWPVDKNGAVLPGRQMPVHDKHSHPATAWVMGMRTRFRGMLTVRSKQAESAAARSLVITDMDETTKQARRVGESAIVGGRGPDLTRMRFDRTSETEPAGVPDSPWGQTSDDDDDDGLYD